MSLSTVPVEDVDLFSDEVLLEPYETYRRLRDEGAVVHLPAGDLYALTRYDEVRAALGDPATFTSTRVAFNPTMNEVLKGTSLASDPPEHTRLRAVLTENLSPRALRKVKDDIDAKADAMVRDLAQRGSFEGMGDLARALPLSIVADMIGVNAEIKAQMLDWGEAAFNLLGPLNQRAQASFGKAQELFQWSHNIQASELAEGSMGRAIFAAAERGEIPYESCGMIIHQYVAAGMDTTITSIGNAIALFGEHPDQFELLRSDPSLVPSAFAEVLRYQAPFPATGRGTTRDVEYDGVTIPAGSQVAVLLASGNRDERHYEDPDAFLIRRNPLDHLSFGYGIHGCAGQGLARLEAHAAITALARHVKSYRIGASPRRVTNMTRAFATLEVLDVVPA